MQATEETPWLILCQGAQRAYMCAGDASIEPIDFDNEQLDDRAADLEESGRTLDYDAYRLAPGTYTAVILSGCEEGAPCPAAGTPFTLLAAAATPRQ